MSLHAASSEPSVRTVSGAGLALVLTCGVLAGCGDSDAVSPMAVGQTEGPSATDPEQVAKTRELEANIAAFLGALNDAQWRTFVDAAPVDSVSDITSFARPGFAVGRLTGVSELQVGVDESWPWDEEAQATGAPRPMQTATLRLELTEFSSPCPDATGVNVVLDTGFDANLGHREVEKHPILGDTGRLEGAVLAVAIRECSPEMIVGSTMMVMAADTSAPPIAGSPKLKFPAKVATFSDYVDTVTKSAGG